MDEILCGLPFAFVYLDEMLIASRTHEEHMQHLQQVLTIFKQHGLVLNGEKCALGASAVDYLGHKVTAEGINQSSPRPCGRHQEISPTIYSPAAPDVLRNAELLPPFHQRSRVCVEATYGHATWEPMNKARLDSRHAGCFQDQQGLAVKHHPVSPSTPCSKASVSS